MNEKQKITVGVVGLGNMGLGIGQTLAREGFRVTGFDVSDARRSLAAGAGVETLYGLAEVFAVADFVVLSLPTGRDVRAVVNEHASMLGRSIHRRVVILDTSTSEPEVSKELARQLEAMGHGFLDAPVSGGPAGAANGKLTMMIGGSEADVTLARPVIEAMCATVVHVGPSGAGNVAKLVNNLLVAAHMITTSEGLKLAASAGVDPEAVLRTVNAASGRSFVSEVHFPAFVVSERFDSGFSAGLMRKDVRLGLDMAARSGAELPLLDIAGKLWEKSAVIYADGDDFTRMGDFKTGHRLKQ